jgi:hypothetical protein
MGELTILSFQASSMHEELAKNPGTVSKLSIVGFISDRITLLRPVSKYCLTSN